MCQKFRAMSSLSGLNLGFEKDARIGTPFSKPNRTRLTSQSISSCELRWLRPFPPFDTAQKLWSRSEQEPNRGPFDALCTLFLTGRYKKSGSG